MSEDRAILTWFQKRGCAFGFLGQESTDFLQSRFLSWRYFSLGNISSSRTRTAASTCRGRGGRDYCVENAEAARLRD